MSGKARLGSHYFDINPDSIRWGYSLNTQEIDTYGGRVIQLLSCSIEGITVEGYFGSRRGADKYAAMQEFERWVIQAMSAQQSQGRAMTFSYPPRGWSAKVFLASFPSVKYDLDIVAPRFSLSLVVDEGMDSLVESSKKQELQKIINGVQWGRSKYNDPHYDQNSWEQAYEKLKQEFGSAGLYNIADPSQFAAPDGSDVSINQTETAATSTNISRPNDTGTSSGLVSVGDSMNFNIHSGLVMGD